jgi:hypothetical protein
MRSLVVYESWFGNTQQIADKIAAALAAEGGVQVVSVDDPLPSLIEIDLVVLGAPTHVHGLSSTRSRKGAIDQRGDAAPAAGSTGSPPAGRVWLSSTPVRTSRNCSSARLHTGSRAASSAAATGWPPSRRASSCKGRPVRWNRASSTARGSGGGRSRTP